MRVPIERLFWPPIDVAVDDDLRTRLVELYSPEVTQLRLLTGQDFSTWSL